MSTGVISNLTLPLNTIINLMRELSSSYSAVISAINSFHNSFNVAHADIFIRHRSDFVSFTSVAWSAPFSNLYGVIFHNVGKGPCKIDGFPLPPGLWMSVSSHRTFPLDNRFNIDATSTEVNIYCIGY